MICSIAFPCRLEQRIAVPPLNQWLIRTDCPFVVLNSESQNNAMASFVWTSMVPIYPPLGAKKLAVTYQFCGSRSTPWRRTKSDRSFKYFTSGVSSSILIEFLGKDFKRVAQTTILAGGAREWSSCTLTRELTLYPIRIKDP